jgi:hypothetical protein
VTLTIDEGVVATARCRQRAPANGNGARIASGHPAVVAVMISRKHACEMVAPVVCLISEYRVAGQRLTAAFPYASDPWS